MGHRALIVEDEKEIADSVITILNSLGHEYAWAQSQEDARRLIVSEDFTYALVDLQIPVRAGHDMPRFSNGQNLVREIHAVPALRAMPMIVMTAFGKEGLDVASALFGCGVVDFISKPFPATGRTLDVVIESTLHRYGPKPAEEPADPDRPLRDFSGGVLAFYPDRVELCGEIITTKGQKGRAWQILHILREKNERGRYIALGSTALAGRLNPVPVQNTLIRSIGNLRASISRILEQRSGQTCRTDGVIVNDEQGYHLRNWIVVEVYDEIDARTPAGAAAPISCSATDEEDNEERFSERQRWALAELASGRKLTRRQMEEQFDVSERTAKRELRVLTEAGLIEFDRSQPPGDYRLK